MHYYLIVLSKRPPANKSQILTSLPPAVTSNVPFGKILTASTGQPWMNEYIGSSFGDCRVSHTLIEWSYDPDTKISEDTGDIQPALI